LVEFLTAIDNAVIGIPKNAGADGIFNQAIPVYCRVVSADFIYDGWRGHAVSEVEKHSRNSASFE
jgi:hypothetical protein